MRDGLLGAGARNRGSRTGAKGTRETKQAADSARSSSSRAEEINECVRFTQEGSRIMGGPRKKPAEGGAVTGDGFPSDPVRPQIQQMTGHTTEEEMAASLPDNTMTPTEEEAPRRKYTRRTKAEMAAARGEVPATDPNIDPLMQDERYRKIVEKMRGKTLTTTVTKGFEIAAVSTKDESWKLEREEVTEVDDVSYVLAKRYPVLDPTNHWLSMAVYSFAILGGLIFKRAGKAAVGGWIQSLMASLGGEEQEEDKKEEAN